VFVQAHVDVQVVVLLQLAKLLLEVLWARDWVNQNGEVKQWAMGRGLKENRDGTNSDRQWSVAHGRRARITTKQTEQACEGAFLGAERHWSGLGPTDVVCGNRSSWGEAAEGLRGREEE